MIDCCYSGTVTCSDCLRRLADRRGSQFAAGPDAALTGWRMLLISLLLGLARAQPAYDVQCSPSLTGNAAMVACRVVPFARGITGDMTLIDRLASKECGAVKTTATGLIQLMAWPCEHTIYDEYEDEYPNGGPFIDDFCRGYWGLERAKSLPALPNQFMVHHTAASSVLNGKNLNCQYGPAMARDHFIPPPPALHVPQSTAWCEGVKGHGIHEILLIPIQSGVPLEIWAGFGKSPTLFAANSRPKNITLSVLEATMVAADPVPSEIVGQTKLLSSMDHTLLDFDGYQILPVPKVEVASNARLFLALTIRTVYPGSQFEDTCVSDVRVRPPR